MLRSNLGTHYAGHGMAYPLDYNNDDIVEYHIPKSKQGCKLPTDSIDKKELSDYCKQQSGEVITYNLYDKRS